CAQDVRDMFHQDSLSQGKRLAIRVMEALPTCPIPEIARLGRTLRKWKTTILAYFDTDGASNGGTEAVNGLIELGRRIARGFRNFDHYRLRMLLIAGGLDERSRKIRDEIAAAERARQDAKVALAGYEQSLIEARSESKKILDETKVYQLQLAAELKAKADVELAKMKDRARRDIDSAKKIAISEIYAEATNLATIMAGKILQRQVTEQDHARLMEESLSELSKMNN
ncbi:MAG: transposase, partial [Chloroflexi bacterium]|nr:transposase [Chloroflexota bacterium]